MSPPMRDTKSITKQRTGSRIRFAHSIVISGKFMKKSRIGLVGAAVSSALACGYVSAETLDTGIAGLQGTWVSNITTGIGVRTKAPSCALTGSAVGCGSAANVEQWANGDDGNLNYRKNQAYTGYVSGTSELLLTMPDAGYKFLARGTAMYDFLADRTERTELSSDVRSQAVYSGQLDRKTHV